MSNGDLFYACGIALAVSAVALSIVGLRSEKFPGKALPAVILWFAVLVGGATTFAVLHAQDEERPSGGAPPRIGRSPKRKAGPRLTLRAMVRLRGSRRSRVPEAR